MSVPRVDSPDEGARGCTAVPEVIRPLAPLVKGGRAAPEARRGDSPQAASEKASTMGKERFAPPAVRLSVASFNRRAVTVYKRAGFQIIGEEKVRTNGGIYNFIKMELDQSNGNQASDSKRH